MIASPHNPLVKHLVKLREQRDYREEQQSVLIPGFKLIAELSTHTPPKRLFLEDPSDASIAPQCPEIIQVNRAVLKKITGLPSPEPVAAEFSLPPPANLKDASTILVMNAIQDPGNFGTLLRTALAFGWEGVFFLQNCVDPFNEKVIRASRAALFRLPWRQGSWDELSALKKEEDFSIYIADIEGKPLSSIVKQKNCMLVLSNEAQGVNTLKGILGEKITIPMEGDMESLNVAVAGAILMYHLKK